jgi:hypothetical protein
MKSRLVLAALLLVSAFAMTGCVSSSGVVPTGPDTFMVSHSEKGTKLGPAMKAAALEEANAYCKSRGKVMKVIGSSQKDMVLFTSDAYAEVHFKALDPNDPEATAPTDTGLLTNRVFKGDEHYQSVSVEIDKRETNAAAKDTLAEIERLGDLLKKGLITQEEFDSEKKKLLKSRR